MTAGSPSSSIAPHLSSPDLAGRPRLPARASRSERGPRPRASCTACGPKPPKLQGPLLSATTTLCGTSRVFLLPGLYNSSGKTALEAACPHSNPPSRSGAATGSPAPGSVKAPRDGDGAARARAEAPGLRLEPHLTRAGVGSPLALHALCWFVG